MTPMSMTRPLPRPVRRTALTFAALLASGMLAQSAAAQATSTTNAVTAALSNNADVKTAQANLAKAQATNRAVQDDPSSLVLSKLSASNNLLLAQASLRGARLGTLQNTITTYTGLLEAQQNVELQTLQVQVDTKAVQIAQTKLSIGNATNLDVQNAQNNLAASQQALADAKAQVNLASAKLATLTGLGSGIRASSVPTVPKLSVSLATLRGGLNNLASVVAASNDVSSAQLNVKLANNDFTPARTLQDAQTALANAQRSLQSAQNSASQTLSSAYQAAQNSYDLLAVAQSREAAAQKTYNQDAARLKSGTISAVDLQNTQLILKKAQYSRLQAQDNVLQSLAALSVAAGQNLTGVGSGI